MRRLTRVIAAVVPAIPLALFGLGVTAGPASAAGCYGYSCYGYDMYHFGCTYNSTTAAAATANGVVLAYVYNRYSSGCKSNWAEAQLTPAGYAAGDSMDVAIRTHESTYDSVMWAPETQGNQGLLDEPYSGEYYGTSSIYTDMVDGTNMAYATVVIYHGGNFVTHAFADQ